MSETITFQVEEEEPMGKPDYMELAKIYGLTLARLEWLHEQFQNFFPAGVVDNYPEQPAGNALHRVSQRKK